jgi:hypothetical protein
MSQDKGDQLCRGQGRPIIQVIRGTNYVSGQGRPIMPFDKDNQLCPGQRLPIMSWIRASIDNRIIIKSNRKLSRVN